MYVIECMICFKLICKKFLMVLCFCFQAEDGIRDLVRSRGLGDVYKRQESVNLVAKSSVCE